MSKAPSSKSKVTTWAKKVIPRSLRSQDSSNASDVANGRGLDPSPSRPYAQVTPDSVPHDGNDFLSPNDGSEQDHSLKLRPSRESAHLTISPTRSRRGRRSSASLQKPAVRLPGLEQAIAPAGTTRVKAGQVLVTLIIAYHQAQADPIQVYTLPDATVDYEETTAFDELDAIATKELATRIGGPAEAFYLKVGRFRLVHGPDKVYSRGILESRIDWDEHLPRKIPEFIGQHGNVPYHVIVEWEYSRLEIKQEPDETYATTIGKAIEEKIQKNWEGRKYVPRKDLDRLLTRDTISKLIRDDKSLHDTTKMFRLTGGGKLDEAGFVEEVWTWCTRLLALCVYVDLDLICLYHMWVNGLKDKDLPLTEDHCPDPAYRIRFDMAVKAVSGAFAAHTFTLNEEGLPEHRQLPDGAVVPILFNQSDPACLLGKGSFGRVYKARIDRDHHSFSTFENAHFALKIFYDLSAHTQRGVEDESSTLTILAEVPHDNVTTHLASWNQGGICYMLFPCADCNLRTYMRDKPSPEWTKSNLLALLSQMRGLADGLRYIHNLEPANLAPERVNENAKQGEHRPSHTCYHHDLKPANILVTRNPDTGNLLFSISDFGSAKIGQILSGSIQPSPFTKSLSAGDLVYGAPDAELEGRTSRPYDLWSMGCIFLELLTWIVGLEEHNVGAFADKRMEGLVDAHGNQDQAFWYKNTSAEILLKPAVVEQLKILKEKCKGRGVFEPLVRVIGKLLSIRTKNRPDASQLTNDLDAIMMQVKRDLKNENFYIDNMPTEIRIAAPPSSVGDSDDLSRTPSIDERAFPIRYGDSLSPETRANRRSTVGTVRPNIGQGLPVVHSRHQSNPEVTTNLPYPARLNIDAQAEPPSPGNGDESANTPRTPRISFSDFDSARVSTAALLHMGRGDESLPPIGSHHANFAPGLQ